MAALRRRERRAETHLPPDLSPTGKLVYLYLLERGPTTVGDLKDALGVPQLRLYPTLAALERADLIDRSGDEVAPGR